MKTFENLKK